jgi:hypothetical protein
MTLHEWDDGQAASSLPVTPPLWHQITSLPAQECVLKKLQRPLTTFKGQSPRFSRLSSGRVIPPPSRPDLRANRAGAFGLRPFSCVRCIRAPPRNVLRREGVAPFLPIPQCGPPLLRPFWGPVLSVFSASPALLRLWRRGSAAWGCITHLGLISLRRVPSSRTLANHGRAAHPPNG